MLRLALDHNFPTPIVESLRAYVTDAELVSVRDIDRRLLTLDDWELLLALRQLGGWDGLVTTDAEMLRLPREMSVLLQTKLALIVTEGGNNDPIRATGLLLAFLPNVRQRFERGRAQIWRLRVGFKPPVDPWEELRAIAGRVGGTADDHYQANRLSSRQLDDPILV